MESWANLDVSLDLRAGEILCLAGENGAGKSTLMKILYGLEQPTAGTILVNGTAVKIASPLDAGKLGIGMVHQHFMLFPEYTVAENIVMGAEPRRFKLFYDFDGAAARAAAVIGRHGFNLDVRAPAGSLTVGEMQQVEILKLLYRDCRILILDEPTAALADQEIQSLFETLKSLARAGKSLVLITHKLGEIKRVSNRVAVMREGKIEGVWDSGQIDEYAISRIMTGAGTIAGNGVAVTGSKNDDRKIAEGADVSAAREKPALVFENVTVRRRGRSRPVLDAVHFAVYAGEIVGFAGMGGNGLGTLEAVLGGFLPVTAGKIYHRGEDITRLNTRALRSRGLAYVPADRLSVGSAGGASLADNLVINRRAALSPAGIFTPGKVNAFTDSLIARFRIAGKREHTLRSLSGGNIQKLILAREMEQFQDYIVFSEPAWGLDFSARRFVYEQIALLRARGAAIIIISSNIDELLSAADRIIVFYRGKSSPEIPNPAESRENEAYRAARKAEIGARMLGLSPAEETHGL